MNYKSLSPYIASIILLAVILFIPATASAGQNSDYIYYVNQSEVTLVSYLGDGGTVVIPESIDGYPVKHINDLTFSNAGNKISSVIIPSTVCTIGDNAFNNCQAINDFEVDKDNEAFSSFDGVLYNKSKTELIKYPSKRAGSVLVSSEITSIHCNAFLGCSFLTEITLPDDLVYIGTFAFSDCSALQKVHFPESLQKIDGGAFEGCASLCDVNFPTSLQYIGNNSFQYCNSISSITIPNSVNTLVTVVLGIVCT